MSVAYSRRGTKAPLRSRAVGALDWSSRFPCPWFPWTLFRGPRFAFCMAPPSAPHRPPFQKIAVCIALTGLCVVAYYRVGQLPFLPWDDQVYVTQNEPVQEGLTWEGVRWAWSTEQAHNRHPVTWLSHMLDCQLFGSEDATGHHLVNLLLHTSSVLVLFVVWSRMTGQPWAAALAAALFAVHPLNVESVAWVAERKNVLSTLLWLLTMAAYLRYTRHPSWSRYGVMLLVFTLGLMSKQMLVTLPCVLLLLDYWPLQRLSGTTELAGHHRPTWLACILEKLPLVALSAAAAFAVLNVQQVAKATWEDLPLWQRLENAVISYTVYLEHAVWPANLSALYMHQRGMQSAMVFFAGLIILIAITWAVAFPLRHRRYIAVGWLWYLGTLVPVIGIIQVGEQAMADRYAYVPLIGIWIIVAHALGDLVRWRPTLRGWVVAAVAVVLIALTMATQRQVSLWRGMLPLWQHALDIDGNNYRAHFQVALALRREQRLDEALPHFEQAALLEPQHVELHTNLAEALIRAGRMEAAREALNRALLVDPRSVAAHYWLGVLLIREGAYDKGASQLEHALKALRHDADQNSPAGVSESDLLYNLAVARLEQGKYLAAIECLTDATRLAPEDVEASNALAVAYDRFAMQRLAHNRPVDAVAHLRAALEARPNAIEVASKLARLLATHPDARVRDGAEAVRWASLVCRATDFASPTALELLAAAYAETGDFEQAIDHARKAIELAKQYDRPDLTARIEKAMDHYQHQQPLRERSTP